MPTFEDMVVFRSCLFFLAFLIAGEAGGQTMATVDRQALAELESLAVQHPSAKSLVLAAQAHPVALVQGRATVGFLGQLNPDTSPAAWHTWAQTHEAVLPGACRHGVASFRVDVNHLDVLAALPMDQVELASRAVPDLDKARYGTRVDSVHAGFGLPMAFHGEGVLVGVLDWGFDYTHPMFYDTALTASRIRGVWDQYRTAGEAPDGFNYGAASQEPWEIQLMGSDTSNVYGYSTHGTHVAGIAAGGGAGAGLTGMAPASELLLATLMVDEAAALDAFAWMQDVAESDNKRLVINNSWGLPQWGTPDGTSLSNVFIDGLSEDGVVFVSSNGNNGDSNFHIEHTFTASGDTARSKVQFYPLSAHPHAWGQNLTLWGEPGEAFSANFMVTVGASTEVNQSPWFSTADGPFMLDGIHVAMEDTFVYDVVAEAAHPDNGRPFLQLRIHKGTTGLGVALQMTADQGTVHAWNHTHLSNDVGNWGQDFQAATSGWLQGTPAYGIQQPACGESVIAIGAYASEYQNSQGTEVGGSLAYFSSHGPTLDGRLKPNVSAPGVNVESSLSSFRDGTYAVTEEVEFDGTTYEFAKLSGTSMSSPAVAGIVALLLEANPTLSPADVRDILEVTARQDQATGPLSAEGDVEWGHGKVNAHQAVLAALNWVSWVGHPTLPDNPTGEDLMAQPNPAQERVLVSGNLSAQSTYRLVDTRGRVWQDGPAAPTFRIDLQGMPPGVYVVIAKDPEQQTSHTTRVVKTH